ncbi:ABC transporter substrate-binding protein [Halomicrobium mukohataei]|uniref:ABC transporter substrate-binding protein n=1 Tax=Halomicrobium mukohataei TaxID=57705 RepID=UPI0014765D81|nr:ABC transporter substrate-binding protein [Halomicrobium mukohataei]
MARDDGDEPRPTRRKCIAYGTTLLATGSLAGCSALSGQEAESTETETQTGPSYSGTIEPVGERSLASEPERIVGGWGFEEDVLTALGMADKLVAAEGNQFWFTGFYDQLPGVDVPDPASLDLVRTEDWSLKTEYLYELDPDLFATDPNRFISYYGADEADISEIEDSIAPFFGNASRRKRGADWPTWPGDESYAYYDIPEFVSRYGDLFGKSETAAAINEIYRSAMEDMRSRVPPESERPSVGLLNAQINPDTEGSFHAYNPKTEIDKAYGKKQYRDLGVVDAFEGEYGGQSGIEVDYETLLDADPDVIVFHFGVNYRDWNDENALRKTVEGMRDSRLGQELTAVQDDELYVGGSAYQGPIINLFQTEMLGKQLYPDEFGEWPGEVTAAELPTIPEDEQLFDREALAAAVTGSN